MARIQKKEGFMRTPPNRYHQHKKPQEGAGHSRKLIHPQCVLDTLPLALSKVVTILARRERREKEQA